MANTKIPSELIADSSITAAKLADGTITTADIANSNVTTAKIADSGVTTAKIGDAQVTTAKITDANVTTGKIADDAVTTAKMASNSVTSDTIASGITLAGLLTVDGGIDVDNFHLDGTALALSSGDMTLDSAGDIILDADGADVILKDGGTTFLEIDKDGNNARLKNPIADGDIKIQGIDGSSTITAVSFDMSEGGAATFNNDIYLNDGRAARFGNDQDFRVYNDGSHTYLHNTTVNQDIIIKGNDDGSSITALTFDMSNAARATFGGAIVTASDVIFPDTGKATFGASEDLQLYHDGSNSYIKNNTGWLNMPQGGSGVSIANSDFSEMIAAFKVNGSCDLYFNGGKKLETTNTGIYVGGNVLVGKTSDAFGTAGIALRGTVADFIRASGPPININRLSNDGPLIIFHKDSTNVGSIDSSGGDLTIGTGDTGIHFHDGVDSIIPWATTSASYRDNNIDLGTASYRWKDLYISGLNVTASTYNKISSYFSGSYTSGFKFSDMNGGIWYDAGADDLTISAGHANSQLIMVSGGSERMRIDSSGNVLVGKDSDAFSAAGTVIRSSGVVNITRSGANTLNLNRLSSDGSILDFYKDGAQVGSIGAFGVQPYFAGPNSATGGIRLDSTGSYGVVTPTTVLGANRDAATDLGYSSGGTNIRFRNGWFSGDVNATNFTGVADGNTFINFPGSDVIKLFTGGTERLSISSSGAATFAGDVSVPNISVADDIRHSGDSDTYISFEANNQTFYAGGTRALDIAAGSVVFNEGSGDVDFRVESNGNANMLFVDGGQNMVAIGGGAKVANEVLRANGAQVIGTGSAGLYTVAINQSFAPSASKYLRIMLNDSLMGALTITANGNYSNVNAIGVFQKTYSVGINSSNTSIYSAGSTTTVDLGGTSGQFSMGSPTKPNATTYYVPLASLNSSYTIDISLVVEMRGYIQGIASIDIIAA